MAKNKATHRGTCQCCGNLQKLPGEKLSIHGYTVVWGFFNGTCIGSGHKPLEVCRKKLDETVERLRSDAEQLDTAEPTIIDVDCLATTQYAGRRRIRTGGEIKADFNEFAAAITQHYGEDDMGYLRANLTSYGVGLGYDRKFESKAEEFEAILRKRFEDIVDRARNQLRNKARHYRAHADTLVDLANRVHGKPLKSITEEEVKKSNSSPTTNVNLRVKGEHFVFQVRRENKRWFGEILRKGEKIDEIKSARTKADAIFAAKYRAAKYLETLTATA